MKRVFKLEKQLIHACSGQKQPGNFDGIFQPKAYLRKYLKKEMIVRSQLTALLQIVCTIILNFQSYHQ